MQKSLADRVFYRHSRSLVSETDPVYPSDPSNAKTLTLKGLGFLIVFLALSFPHWLCAAESIESLQTKIQLAKDSSVQAKLYQELGEQYVARDRIQQAADAFDQALSLARDSFSATERVQMAIYLSWADRLEESARELKLVLVKEPKNIAARTHLARVLSWSGELREAIAQADRVLQEDPEHEEVRLVKADALQWQGRYGEAIPIYEKLLGGDLDFDARIGLAYAHLGTGNRTGALENANLLKRADLRQENNAKKLREVIDRETRPHLDARYNYYKDSDDNRLDRYTLLQRFWFDNVNLAASFRHTSARDATRSNRAEDFSFQGYTKVTDSIGLGAGAGFTQLHDGKTSNFPTGHVKVDVKLVNGSAGANVTREVLSDTAELVENRIRLTNVGLYVSQTLTERLSVNGGYNYKNFSDGNHANELRFTTQYALYLNPKIAVGHRFRLLDFHEQTGSGYFDPSNYIANRFFGSYYVERDKFYAYVDLYLGYETFRRNGVASDNFIHGGAASFGFKPTPNLALEINVEGGNFAAGSPSGFNYLNIGPRLLYRF